MFKLQVGRWEEVITRDQLKPLVGLALPAVAELPRRGRPPRRGE